VTATAALNAATAKLTGSRKWLAVWDAPGCCFADYDGSSRRHFGSGYHSAVTDADVAGATDAYSSSTVAIASPVRSLGPFSQLAAGLPPTSASSAILSPVAPCPSWPAVAPSKPAFLSPFPTSSTRSR